MTESQNPRPEDASTEVQPAVQPVRSAADPAEPAEPVPPTEIVGERPPAWAPPPAEPAPAQVQQPAAEQSPVWAPPPAESAPPQQPAPEQPAAWAQQPAVGQPAAWAQQPGGQPPGEPPAGQPPVWAQPPGPPPPRPGRAGKAVALGTAAVVLALASGGVGAAVTYGLVDTGVVRVTETHTAAPVVDRSSLAEIAANVQPSVVSIRAGNGEGSGVVLTKDGYILTNNHVVANAAGGNLSVVLSNGKTVKATVVGTDPRSDLAVIKAQGVSDLTPAKFGNSGDMRVGDTVLALGSPLGLKGSVTSGIISALDRTIQAGDGDDQGRTSGAVTSISGVMQTDAAINPGNSGGPLVNLNGEVIGINTAIATAGNGSGNIGVGFAIPSNKAKQVADQLQKGGKVSHAFLGVSVKAAEGGGAEISAIQPNSPAAAAGLQVGDVITKADGTAVNDSDDLVSAVQSHKSGDRVDITYKRGGTEKTTTVTLTEAS